MSLQEQIGKMVNEQIAKAIAKEVMESVNQQMREQWAKVVDELVSHRKRSVELAEEIGKLEDSIQTIIRQIEEYRQQTKQTAQLQEKAKKILDEALKDLNIVE